MCEIQCGQMWGLQRTSFHHNTAKCLFTCSFDIAFIKGFSAKCPAGVDECKQEIPEETAMCDKGGGKSMESWAKIIFRSYCWLVQTKWVKILVQGHPEDVGSGQRALLIIFRGRAYGRKCQVQAAFRYATATDCGYLRKSHGITSLLTFLITAGEHVWL